MTSSVVVAGGAPSVGAETVSRGKGSLSVADSAFAQVLGEVHASAVATGGPAGSADPSDDLLAAWRSTVEGSDGDAASPELPLLVDPANPHEAWNTLATAWAAATAVVDEGVVDEGVVDEGRADRAAEPHAAPGHQRLETGMAPARLESAGDAPVGHGAEPRASTASDVAPSTPHSPEPQGGHAPPMPAAGVRPTTPAGDVAAPEVERPAPEPGPLSGPATAAKTFSEPSHTSSMESAAPVPGRRHASREAVIDVPALSRVDPASPEGAPAGAPVATERPGTPAGGREVERAPSLPDASTIVVPQGPFRATQDAGPSTTVGVTSSATADAAAAVVDQVVKSMRVQWKNGIGEARIQLRPEYLGPVDISIKVDGGSITAVVRAKSSQVQEWILSHQQSLRQQLEAAGLRLDALVVTPDAERRHGREEAEARQRAAHRRRRPAGETPIFEVTV